MTAQEWEFVKQVFEAAIILPEEQRSAYLDAACASQPNLRAVIEQLIENHYSDASSSSRPRAGQEPDPVFAAGNLVADRFRIVRLIARGGMGEVYESLDELLHVRLALKTLRPALAADPDAWARFKREVLVSRDVNHPGICRVYDLIEHVHRRDGRAIVIPCMTMKLLEGDNLRTWLTRNKPVPLEQALKIIDQIASALDALHEHGVVHRDLKPSNIVLVPLQSGRYRAVLTDFGLAKQAAAGGLGFDTQTAFHAGAPFYMAPELFAGDKPSRASDIYSLGLIIDEIVTTSRVFEADHLWALYARKMHEEPVPPSARSPLPLPPEWDRVILQCLDRDPAKRPAHARSIARALGYERRSTSRSATLVARVANAHYRLRRQIRRIPARALVGAALVLAIVGIGVITRMMPPRIHVAAELRRLTDDRGLTAYPTLAPDGSWFAYASDRGSPHLNIWRQSLSSPDPQQLTFGAWDDTDPVISPDQKWIAYRSSREGGAVYLIPSAGGTPFLAGRFAQSPRFAPDSSQLVFWVPDPVSGFGKIYLRPPVGVAEPDQIARDFEDAHNPAFTNDPNYIVFCGTRRSGGPRHDEHDIWIYAAYEHIAVRTEALDRLTAQQATPHHTLLPGTSFAWLGDDLLLTAQTGDTASVWRVPISPKSWKIAGEPERLFNTTTPVLHPSVSGNAMLVSGAEADVDVYSLPLNAGAVTGDARQLTTAGEELMPSVSADGRMIVYLSTLPGGFAIRKRDLHQTEKDVELKRVPGVGGRLKIAPDGQTAVYRMLEGKAPERQAIYSISLADGADKRICADCGGPTDVTRDGHVVYETGSRPTRVSVLRPNGQTTELLAHSHHAVYSARVSPDQSWVAFGLDRGLDGRNIHIAPFRFGEVPEDQWQPLTESDITTEEPWWSPDGSLVYYLSQRDGFRCIEARRIDTRTGRPEGPVIEVKHFHSASLNPLTMIRRQASYTGLSVAADRLVLSLGRVSSNIWMTVFQR